MPDIFTLMTAHHVPQITPQGQFKAASYRIAFDGGNHRFAQQHTTHAKRPLSLRIVNFVEISFGCELQVISRTEGFTGAAKDSDALRGVRFVRAICDWAWTQRTSPTRLRY